jgi:hypothetical protein
MTNLDALHTAVSVGSSDELFGRQREEGAPVTVPISVAPRGLAMTSLQVTKVSEGLWGLLKRTRDIVVLSVSFDLSGGQPVILPPKEVSDAFIYKIKGGETLSFTLGNGLPIYPPRHIQGGLITYILVSEADKGLRHVGEVMEQVHDQMSGKESLVAKISQLVVNPAGTVADEVMAVAVAALQPIATILANNEDDSMGAFSGIFPARGPWANRLNASQNGTTIALAELPAPT